ncbi:MAG: glycoside hydrolase family 30 beta sandwich domain-containing protein [Niabella sp.]
MKTFSPINRATVVCWLLVMFLFVNCGKGGNNPSPTPTPPTPEPPTPPAASSDVTMWLTKADKSVLFKKQTTAINFSATGNASKSITVDSTQAYQTMDGFGFALTGGSAYLINRLPEKDKNNLLKELFTTDSTFIGINYLRISLGASDLSSNVFTYDESETPDPTLSKFDLGPDRYDLIPVLKAIISLQPNIKILASPWTAPTWMKTNKAYVGGSLDPQYYDVYAKYFVKYIEAMKANGITIDAVTVQNEPQHGGNNPSMVMSAAEQAEFVKSSLGPAFKAAGLSTKIIIWDHNCDNPNYPITVLNDPDAKQYIDGSAFHLYGGDISALTTVHNAHPDKNLYFTEQWLGGPGNFPDDFLWHTKNLVIAAPKNWSRNVLEWNLAADINYNPHTPGGCSTCMGGVTIDASITRNANYYAIAHASKFVPAGSKRIASTELSGLSTVAFLTPEGKKVLIALNDGSSAQTFNILFKGKYAPVTLDAKSVATLVW